MAEVELPEPDELREHAENSFSRRGALVRILGGGLRPPPKETGRAGETRARSGPTYRRKSARVGSSRSAMRLRIISTVPPPMANMRASRTMRSSGCARP
jgi:hypothetical protein